MLLFQMNQYKWLCRILLAKKLYGLIICANDRAYKIKFEFEFEWMVWVTKLRKTLHYEREESMKRKKKQTKTIRILSMCIMNLKRLQHWPKYFGQMIWHHIISIIIIICCSWPVINICFSSLKWCFIWQNYPIAAQMHSN